MRALTVCLTLGLVLAFAAVAGAQALDLQRYMPLSEIEPGMTGVGKTTLEGSNIVEFQVKVLAILKNFGPKRDLIVIRCSGAGLDESGVVAGMSGSPVYIKGRLIGAVAYAFPWGKLPLAGVQPIEQMLRVTDAFPWTPAHVAEAGRAPDPSLPSVPVAALGLADIRGRDSCDMQPIRTPLMVSGLPSRAIERLRQDLASFGMVPMQGGAADHKLPPVARLEAGAPLAVTLLRGDIQVAAMGTITEIVGDRLYGFGHAMLGAGEANYPLAAGIAHVVVPSLMNSFRLGAPAREVGHVVWDEETAILGRLAQEPTPMVPIHVTVIGPGKAPDRTYACEMVHHRRLSPILAAAAAGGGLTATSELPQDHTVSYRIRVKPVGYDPIVRENLAVSPNADNFVENQVRSLVGLLMENPFRALKVESVDVQVTVEVVSRLAEIQEVRALRNTVRPGESLPVEVKVRPWRAAPEWLKVEVAVPADYPDGPCRLSLCGADDALRQEMREAPARFRPDDIDGLVGLMRRSERRDQLFIRLDAPGEGIAIGTDELPNLPGSMRTILSGSARRQVTGVRTPRVTMRPMPYVLQGSGDVEFTVNRFAPAP